MEHIETLEDYSVPPSNRSTTAKLIALAVFVCAVAVAWRFLGGPRSALAGQGWNSDWDDAVLQSNSTGKPALVLFTADWCPACRQFESEVLTDSQVKQYLRENYTLVLVDLSDRTGPNNGRARDFGVKAVPTLILYDRAGQEKARGHGMPADTLMLWLKSQGLAVTFGAAR
jgi:thiol:disulfide interchange protein